MSEPASLLPLAESIADGSAIDWKAAEAGATPDQRAVVRQLRILADLALLHRSLPAQPSDWPTAHESHRALAATAVGRWGHLSLVERLGGGTFGEVYRAWDDQLEREVALKLLRAGQPLDDPLASRIVREGRLLARVRHPNVVAVFGVDTHEGRVGLWMELIRGATLEELLRKRGPFSPREAALVGIDLCRALAAIHAAGLVHRDVKAQNVMREEGGRTVLMDLGTGREIDPDGRHAPADLGGTPLYLAPEVFDGAPASLRTDLYSLGVLLFHLVTGSFPVRATTFDGLRAEHARSRAVRLRDARADLPTAFVRVVDRAIAADPGQRYESAGALEADLAQALDETTASPKPEARRRTASWRIGAVIASLAGMLALALLLWPALRGRPAPGGVSGPIRSIAVLPLANLSGDPAQEYFADAMTDELIATLGRLEGLNVISRTSVMQFKGSSKPLPDIARALNVGAILEGSVLVLPDARPGEPRSSKRVRINARLIHAGTDAQLWNRTFEHVLTDVLALQSEVAGAVAEEIDLRLTPQQKQDLASAGSRSPQAQEAYLEGRSYLGRSDRRDLLKAREYLETAVRLDPSYARAHAGLATCYVAMELYGVLPRPEARARATTAALRALQLDDRLPEAHNALADVKLYYDWDWSSAGREYRRALELNSSYSFARSHYARYLAAQNRMTEAYREARRAEEVDPLSAEARGVVALVLFYDRRYDEAIQQFQKALELAPSSDQEHAGLGRAYAGKRDYGRAVAELQQAVTLSGEAPAYLAELARTHALAGEREKALAILTQLGDQAKIGNVYVSSQSLAYVHTALGDNERAFQLLNLAVKERAPGVLWSRVDPRLDSLRADPLFEPFIRQLGLP